MSEQPVLSILPSSWVHPVSDLEVREAFGQCETERVTSVLGRTETDFLELGSPGAEAVRLSFVWVKWWIGWVELKAVREGLGYEMSG